MQITDLVSSANVQFAHCGSVVISTFKSSTEGVDLDTMLRHQQAIIKKYGKISNLALIKIDVAASSAKVSDEVRKKSVEVTTALNGFSRGNATVIMGKGLGATIVRMFMTGFNLMTKASFPIKVFADAHEAVAWLQKLPEQPPEVKDLNAKALLSHFSISP